MKAIVNVDNGGPEVLEVQEKPDLTPKPDTLVIDVKASGLNFADILARKGQYPDGPSKPCVMGYEVSGIVRATGDDVDSSWVGQKIFAMTKFKGQAEQVEVYPEQVFIKPSTLTFEQAAALPVNYLTAYILLVVMGSLQTEESVLIHNVGGGVGLAALEIARHIGAQTYGTASRRKHDFLSERGLDQAIDYRNEDWYEILMELTGGKGVELITDPLGGKEWKRSYKALRATGRLGMFGISSASTNSKGGISGMWQMLKTVIQMPWYHPLPLLNKNRGVFGVNLGHMWHETQKARTWMEKLLDGVEEGWLNPHVDATFSFKEVADAHRYIEQRKNMGKVILTPKQ